MATGEFVTVACKLPAGLIIRINEPPVVVESPHGKHLVEGPLKQQVTLNGSAPQRKMDSLGQSLGEHPMVAAGYGITPNVPKDFFDTWLKENASYPAVANRQIFALTRVESVRSKAVEQVAVRSGFEPLDMKTVKEMGVKIEPLTRDE